jgi:Cu/Ag efflux protein CusF
LNIVLSWKHILKHKFMKNKNIISMLRGFKMMSLITLFCCTGRMNAQAQGVKGQTMVASTTATATVTKINQKTREVTIKTSDGKEHSFVASKEVKNLAQVKKGDVITVNYTEALAYEVKEHNQTGGVSTTQAVASADSGAMPAGVIAQQTTVTVMITAIDPSVPTVTFMGPKGNKKTITVKDPEKLKGVKVGDRVDITYTEAIGIKVDPAPKKN